ncbi:hypothetical protein [Roseovarius sp. M141]|uniref:bestrophin-like domain n=1 Tax=Roseovarius sp. M141 TaxID=2583806 RepID=UPI0020CE7E46|nr:hypothetical protein [Roseovarius sp. M141]MCQ0093984.1 hypothetical protein [Roseovarius sp. M141]
MHWLFDLPVPVSSFLFIAATIGLGLTSYGVSRSAFGAGTVQETRDLAGSVLFRIAALHSLVLALIFAQELGSIRNVEIAAAREATILGDVYYDAARYGAEPTEEIRRALARYGRIVVEEEWDSLAETGLLTDAGWQSWYTAYEGLLDLQPSSARQERLLDIMISDIRGLSELRESRENAVRTGASVLFLMAGISGITLLAAAFFTWPPTALNLSLLSCFTGYAGLIIYLILAFANPYQAPGAVLPVGFERFLTDSVKDMAQ